MESRDQNPRGLWLLGFWPRDFRRDSIHHSTLSAFPNNVPILTVVTTQEKWRFVENLGKIVVHILGNFRLFKGNFQIFGRLWKFLDFWIIDNFTFKLLELLPIVFLGIWCEK